MDANAYELKKILNLERRYVIPTFQRDYEWTKEGQWELLFEDLEATAARLGKARDDASLNGEAATAADRRVSPHFLGAIVLERVPSPAGSLDIRAVVDGQQRLTTLQLLLRGMLDALMEIESPRALQLRRLLENPLDVITRDEERHKLWPRRRDRDEWQTVMADEASDGNHRYNEARRFFLSRTRSTIGDEAPLDKASLLVDAVMDLFKLVVIDLDENDDAQVIFEVLNGRVTQLSAADLVKNLLFLRAEETSEAGIEQLYQDTWAQFDDPWWKNEVGRGHAARMHSDMLLAAWITARSGDEISPNNLYGQIRRFVSEREQKIPDLLSEIRDYSSEYRVIRGEEPETDLRISVAYRRIQPLAGTTALPLLLWLRTLPSTRLSAESHRQAVVAIESFVIRRAIARYQTRGYGEVFRSVLSKAQEGIQDESADVGTVVVDALTRAPSSREWPTDDVMREVFRNARFYGPIGASRLRMLLGAIDAYMQQKNPYSEQGDFNYEQLQIEHVMPRSWEEHWPLPQSDADREVLAEKRRRAVDRIGNLTLVTGSLNPSQDLSNAGWLQKRQALQAHSALRLNADIVTRDTWDEQAIQARAEVLFAAFREIWPGPTAQPDGEGEGQALTEVTNLLDKFAPSEHRQLVDRFVHEVSAWDGVRVWVGQSKNEAHRRIFFSRRYSQLGAFAWLHPGYGNVRPRLTREDAPSTTHGLELLDTDRPYQLRVRLQSEEELELALQLAAMAHERAVM